MGIMNILYGCVIGVAIFSANILLMKLENKSLSELWIKGERDE